MTKIEGRVPNRTLPSLYAAVSSIPLRSVNCFSKAWKRRLARLKLIRGTLFFYLRIILLSASCVIGAHLSEWKFTDHIERYMARICGYPAIDVVA